MNVTCPMQMFSTLKENHFPHCLTPSCSANQEGKGGEAAWLDSFFLLFQEAVWENNCSGCAFQNSISSPSHQQRAFLSQRSCCTHALFKAPPADPHDHSWKLLFVQSKAQIQVHLSGQNNTCLAAINHSAHSERKSMQHQGIV